MSECCPPTTIHKRERERERDRDRDRDRERVTSRVSQGYLQIKNTSVSLLLSAV